jgi:hypothetical protein
MLKAQKNRAFMKFAKGAEKELFPQVHVNANSK